MTPRGGSDRIDGVESGALRVRVVAPPADGAANAALLRLLARELSIPAGAVRLVSGAAARRKIVAVRAPRDRLVARWPGLLL